LLQDIGQYSPSNKQQLLAKMDTKHCNDLNLANVKLQLFLL